MKSMFRSIAMAFSMFSIIPMPHVEWEGRNMRYMLCALPLVGIVVGAVLCGWFALSRALGFGTVLYAAGMALLPILISGGVHMDGFCDTVDALSSHAEPERKREILKDSHAGAFAIVATVSYVLLYTALCTEVYTTWDVVLIVAIQQVLARAIGGLGSVTFPSSGKPGLLSTFREAASGGAAVILVIWCVLCAVALIVISPVAGIVCVLLAGICLLYLYFMSRRQFGGMSGDLAGYIISLSPLVMLFGLVIVEKVMML